jgi:STE24 endopeptidase
MGLAAKLILFYGFYTLFRIGLELREIRFIYKRLGDPVLLSPERYWKAGYYKIARHILESLRLFVNFLLFTLWIGGGLTLLNYLIYDGSELSELKMVALFFGINLLFLFPLELLEKFIDWKFGVWKGNWKLFLVDTLKTIALIVVFGLPVAYGVIYFVENFDYWWLYSFFLFFGTVLLVNQLFPYLIQLFHKLRPLEEGELKRRIEELLEREGFKNGGVFVIDTSTRDNRLNAFFTGFGRTKRIILFDNLVNRLNEEELLAVLGHELGHFKNRDIWKRSLVVGVVLFLLFYIIGHIPPTFYLQLHIFEVGATLLALIYLFLEPLLFFLQPIIHWLYRTEEFKADREGVKSASPDALISALQKLVEGNISFPRVSKLYSLLYYTHPPVLDRIERLKGQNV